MNSEKENRTCHLVGETSHLTAKDYLQCRDSLSGIIIAPFEPANAKGVGYNFSLSEMIYSVTKRCLVPICREAHETYFYLQPHDTVLALSYEYLKVDDNIAGDFHSRVRMTAQGIGSTSTTLDPGWKGMLLFSLNNPTKKKIKIVLSTRIDGVTKQQPILTLVTWRVNGRMDSDDKNQCLSLHLDNPPMRIDIWSELTVKPLRLFQNRKYQHFVRLIKSLCPFEAEPSKHIRWAEELNNMITDLQIAIEVNKDEQVIRTLLKKIQSVGELPKSMKDRLEKLTKCMVENGKNQTGWLLSFCSKPEYQKLTELAKREIEYLLLCDQINQIHDLISKQAPKSWRKNFLANLWNHFLKNIGIMLSTVYFVFIILLGQKINNMGYWQELILAFVPLVVSVTYHIMVEKN